MARSGFAPTLMSKVDEDGVVDRMLQKSPGLDSRIQASLHTTEDGRVIIIPEEIRVANVARKVAFGLYCHRYTTKTPVSLEEFFALKPMHERDRRNFIVAMAYSQRFRPRRWTHIQTLTLPGHNKRVQVFDYMFVRNGFGGLWASVCLMRFHETIWAAVRCPSVQIRKNIKRRASNLYAGQRNLDLLDWPAPRRPRPPISRA